MEGQPKRILYVEDNVDTADAVKIILTHAGYAVDTANSGAEALKKTQGVELFLLDIMLPDMSGWDIFQKLKAIQGAKFAFLSAIPVSSERMEELKSSGVSDYITKPFTKTDLISRIKAIIG